MISCGLDKFFNIERKKAVNNLLMLLLLVYICWMAVMVVRINPLWRDQITYFEYLIKIYPEDLETHLNLGVAYDENGRKDDAFKEYKKAIELDPNVFNVHANLGGYYAEKNSLTWLLLSIRKQ